MKLKRYVVVDVISSPNCDQEYLKDLSDKIQNFNLLAQKKSVGEETKYYVVAPRNSIIGKISEAGLGAAEDIYPEVMYPFFFNNTTYSCIWNKWILHL